MANDAEIAAAVQSLVVRQGRIVVNHPDATRWLAYTFIETDRASWSSFREVGLYQITAEAIKAATQLGYIGETDLWGTDKTLWEKLCAADHPHIRQRISLISPGTRFTWDDQHPAFRVTTKVRSIDPPIAGDNGVTTLSRMNPVFEHYRKEYLAGKQGPWPMGIVFAPGVPA